MVFPSIKTLLHSWDKQSNIMVDCFFFYFLWWIFDTYFKLHLANILFRIFRILQ